MSVLESLLFAIMQGISELFPVSSLGHGVLIPAILNWDINRQNPDFLPFLVVLHLGTAGALLIFFWRDWKAVLFGIFQRGTNSPNSKSRLLSLLIVATIPAGILGLLLEKKLRLLFGGYNVVAVFLMLNGIILLVGDSLKHRESSQSLESLSWRKALFIGFAQSLALVPGISRSGITLVAGLVNGLNYAESAHFSFLLATPIIGSAGILEVPKLFHEGVHMSIGLVFFSGLIAGLFAYLSTWILMRYFKSHEIKALRPFGFYCMILGAIALLWHHRSIFS